MEYLVGVGVAVLVCAFASMAGFDRDRVYYPTLLAVIATYYILFAAVASSAEALAWESLAAVLFLAMAVAGFRNSLWLAAGALIGHGVFDYCHHLLIVNPGVPVWWPGFCLSFDAMAGAWLAWLLVRRPGFATSGAWNAAAVRPVDPR